MPYLQVNHELNESLTVVNLLHGDGAWSNTNHKTHIKPLMTRLISHRRAGHAGYGGRAVKRESDSIMIGRSAGLLRDPPSPAWTGGWWEEGAPARDSSAARGARGRASAALKLGHVTGWWKHREILKAEIKSPPEGATGTLRPYG